MDHLPLQTRTCLFTDIVGSTFLKASLDPRTARAVFMRSIEIFKECLPPKDVEYDDSALQREAAGRIVGDTGDGVFAVFVSALDAVETALKVQWRMARETWPTEQPVTIRIGLDVGDTTTRPDAVHGIDQPFGTVTDSAARVMSLGAGGQILLTQGVSYLISNGLRRHPFHREGDDSLGDLRLQLESHGNYRFKGDRVAEGARPLEVFEVRPVALGPCSRPEASEKCWPCDDSGQAVTGWRPLPGLEVPGTHPDKWVLEQRIGVGGFGAAWLAHNRSNAKHKRVFKFCYDLARARSFRREKKLFDLLNQALEKDPKLRANIAAIERSSMEATSSAGGPDPLPPYWVQSQHYIHGNLLAWALVTYGTAEQQLTPEMTEEEQHTHLCKALALIPEKVRLALWVELARTTHAVHQHGIIHRDLKPTNIFVRVDQDGTPHPVLADFGIGMIDDFSRLEAAGFTRGGFLGTEFDNNSSRTGTRLYTPPEALRGEKPTASWDIYALGVLLYQFVRGDAALPMDFSWDQHVNDPILRADIGKGVFDGPKRWPTAAEFAESVAERDERRHLLAEENAQEQLRAEQQRARRLQFTVVASTCLTILILGLGIYGWWQAKIARSAEIGAKKASLAAKAAESKTFDQVIERARNAHGTARDAFEQRKDLPVGFAHLAEAVRYNRNLPSDRQLQAIDREAVTRLLTHPLPDPIPLTEPMRHDASVNTAEFSFDSKRIVTASDDNTARLWDAANGKLLGETMHHNDKVNRAAFSPDGQRVVTASDDKTAQVWDAFTGKPIGEPMRHEEPVWHAFFSPDSQRVLTYGSNDKAARLWDASSGMPMGTPLRHDGWVFRADFSPDGKHVVTASYDKTARLWDAISGKPLGLPMHHDDIVQSADFSPDGQLVVTASYDKTARLWDAASGKSLGVAMRHAGRVKGACFSLNNQRVLTVDDDRTVRLWDASNGMPVGEPMRHQDVVNRAVISRDSQRVVTICGDKTVQLWDAASGKPVGVPMHHGGEVHRAVFSPDCQRVVTASADDTARLWDTTSGKPLSMPMRHENRVRDAVFSPDGQRVLTFSDDKTARVWDVASSKSIGAPLRHADRVNCAVFSPDRQRALTGSDDKTARLWEVASGKPIGAPMRHEACITTAVFSPDGQRVITASFDNTARLWDGASAKPIGEPLRHDGWVWCAFFSPDGKRVVTAGNDKTARIWDAFSGKPLGAPMRHEGEVVIAAFTLDGQRVATASVGSQSEQLWDVASSKLLGSTSELHEDDLFIPKNLGSDGVSKVGAEAQVLGLPSQSIAAQFGHLTEWGGLRINEDGQSETITNRKRAEWRTSMLALTPAALTTWEAMFRWLLSDPRTRSINFTSKISGPEHLEREITWALAHLEATRKNDSSGASDHSVLTDAYALNPGFPLIHVALAAIQENAASRDFLIGYGLETLAAWEKTPEAKNPPSWAPAPGHLRAKTAIILQLQDQQPRAKEVFAELIARHDTAKATWASPAWIATLPDFEWPKVFRDALVELAR